MEESVKARYSKLNNVPRTTGDCAKIFLRVERSFSSEIKRWVFLRKYLPFQKTLWSGLQSSAILRINFYVWFCIQTLLSSIENEAGWYDAAVPSAIVSLAREWCSVILRHGSSLVSRTWTPKPKQRVVLRRTERRECTRRTVSAKTLISTFLLREVSARKQKCVCWWASSLAVRICKSPAFRPCCWMPMESFHFVLVVVVEDPARQYADQVTCYWWIVFEMLAFAFLSSSKIFLFWKVGDVYLTWKALGALVASFAIVLRCAAMALTRQLVMLGSMALKMYPARNIWGLCTLCKCTTTVAQNGFFLSRTRKGTIIRCNHWPFQVSLFRRRRTLTTGVNIFGARTFSNRARPLAQSLSSFVARWDFCATVTESNFDSVRHRPSAFIVSQLFSIWSQTCNVRFENLSCNPEF